MRLSYSTSGLDQNELDSLPRLPLILSYGQKQVAVSGLVDSGATINVLPYHIGIDLGAAWDERRAKIRLGGNLGAFAAMPLVTFAQVGDFDPVRLAFAWTRATTVSLILGQMNFFQEYDICFFRAKGEFEINPKGT